MPATHIAYVGSGPNAEYCHWPLGIWQSTQCFSTAFQYDCGTSSPDSAPHHTPSRPYCEFELSHGFIGMSDSGSGCVVVTTGPGGGWRVMIGRRSHGPGGGCVMTEPPGAGVVTVPPGPTAGG